MAVRYNWRLKAYAVLGCARICNIYTTMAVAVDHITLYALLGFDGVTRYCLGLTASRILCAGQMERGR